MPTPEVILTWSMAITVAIVTGYITYGLWWVVAVVIDRVRRSIKA